MLCEVMNQTKLYKQKVYFQEVVMQLSFYNTCNVNEVCSTPDKANNK